MARVMSLNADVLPELDDAIAWLKRGRGRRAFEVPPIDANQSLREALARRGFFARRFQAMLACEPRIVDLALPAGIEIREPTPAAREVRKPRIRVGSCGFA
jgi:hypothetical protein